MATSTEALKPAPFGEDVPAGNTPLRYETMERLKVERPVDRVAFISGRCKGKRVLDIGCLDETAIEKRDTDSWLHARIAALASRVTGIDISSTLPPEGLETAPNARIHRGNGIDPELPGIQDGEIDVIVAGEFIEHIESPLTFFANMRQRFPGRELLISTPNGVSFGNTLLGTIGREAQHPDHVHLFTYKVLHTLCQRAGFSDWDIVPYRFYATEMILTSSGFQRLAARGAEKVVRTVERMFPLLSFGYVVRAGL